VSRRRDFLTLDRNLKFCATGYAPNLELTTTTKKGESRDRVDRSNNVPSKPNLTLEVDFGGVYD
jgi:hypothetical protein